MAFEDVIFNLESWGFVDVVLPFLLIFTIIFAVLQKSKVFGEDRKNMNVVIALVIGLLVVIPHITGSYPQGADAVDIINSALPNISIVLVAIVALLLLLGIFGFEMADKLAGGVVALAILTVLFVFGAAAGWWGDWNWITSVFGEDAITVVIIILVFAAIIWYITSGDGGKPVGKGMSEFFESLVKKK